MKVLAMVKYMSFREMLENEGLMNCLPNCADIDSGVEIYHAFPNYKAMAMRNGVIAFRITTDIKDASPVRPLMVVRGGKPSHILTKQEIQKLSQFGSGNKQVRWIGNHAKHNNNLNGDGHGKEKRSRSRSR